MFRDHGDAASAVVGTLYAWQHRNGQHSWGREARATDILAGATMLTRGSDTPAYVPTWWRWEWCPGSVTVIDDD
jgi:hypothetical protein